MNKQNLVHPYNEILLGNEKNELLRVATWMNFKKKCLVKEISH